MAAQGQSVFGAEGDTGAFSCIRSDGTTIVNVLDPPSQPWVTSVGGTSFENFNPGANTHPSYPTGQETVWNFRTCAATPRPARPTTTRAASSGARRPAPAAAAPASAGAGRSTRRARASTTRSPPSATARPNARWPRPARRAARCRTSRPTPTSSPRTPSTAPATRTPRSACAGTFSASQPPRLVRHRRHQPVLAAGGRRIIADRDSFQGNRSGNINPMLYRLYQFAPSLFFHDITGARPHRHEQRPVPGGARI